MGLGSAAATAELRREHTAMSAEESRSGVFIVLVLVARWEISRPAPSVYGFSRLKLTGFLKCLLAVQQFQRNFIHIDFAPWR